MNIVNALVQNILLLLCVYRLDLYWVDNDEELTQNANVVNGQSIAINSYGNETLMDREITDTTRECNFGKLTTPSISPICLNMNVTLKDYDDQSEKC